MNERDAVDGLTDRLHELGQRAPVPAADTLSDLRRGRSALRRRRARNTGGIGAGLVAACAVAVWVGGLGRPGGSTGTILDPATSPSGNGSPTSTLASGAKQQCLVGMSTDRSQLGPTKGGIVVSPQRWMQHQRKQAHAPEVTAGLTAYRNAAAAILDPTGAHLDPADNDRSDNVQSGFGCDPETGEHLTSLGTKIGWSSGGALGVVRIEVDSPGLDQQPQVVLGHDDGWRPYQGQLPAEVVSARTATFTEDGGGHAVVVERTDGLTVAVDTSGVWGNNVAPGSPSATDLPAVSDLLALAASPALSLPSVLSGG